MNGDKKIYEKILPIEDIQEIENAFAYNCSSSVGYAEKKLKPIINFFGNENVELKIMKNKSELTFQNLQSFKEWLKEEKFEYIYIELRNNNLK